MLGSKSIHTHIDLPDFERIKRYAQSLELHIGACATVLLTEIIKQYNELGFWVEEEKMLRKPKAKHSYNDIHISLDQDSYNKLGNIANDMKTTIGSCTRRLFRIFFIARSIKQIRSKLATIKLDNFKIVKPKISERWRRWRKNGRQILTGEIKRRKK